MLRVRHVLYSSLHLLFGGIFCFPFAARWWTVSSMLAADNPPAFLKKIPSKAGNGQPGIDNRIRGGEFHRHQPQAGGSERIQPADLVGRQPGSGGSRARGAAALGRSLPGFRHQHPGLHPPNFAAL